jgi:hypothetical protein
MAAVADSGQRLDIQASFVAMQHGGDMSQFSKVEDWSPFPTGRAG